MAVDEILGQLGAFDHVVLTGGEPMLFDAVVPLASECRQRGKTITIETAGTIFREVECDLMSISPKLLNSVPHEHGEWAGRHDSLRLNILVLSQLIGTYPYQLKFVVSALSDIAEIEELVAEIGGVEPSRILLMPEGRDSVALWEKARLLVPEVMARNWRLSPRLQIDLFGDTKGT